ncbi:MAG TPA: hypothetical protein VFB43_00935 [Terracidiphilus sp.]|nr:hypothetical protein [Terracidiphilus sp.]
MNRRISSLEKRAHHLRISLAFYESPTVEWSEQDKQRLKELAGKMSPADIGKELGRSKNAVLHCGRRIGISVGFQRTPKCRQRQEEILALIEENLSRPQIARRMGLSETTIRGRMKRMGVNAKIDGRGCAAPRAAQSRENKPRIVKPKAEKRPLLRVIKTVSRVAYCKDCHAPVVNTWDGWRNHRERTSCKGKAA